MEEKQYIAIDLKSFYASVECVERGLDPMKSCLVVADKSRTSKTICLAVSPALKSFGIPGRGRLFEVEQKVREINDDRRAASPRRRLTSESSNIDDINSNSDCGLGYIVACPRMAKYVEYSNMIYDIYLRYISPEDIHIYSIDEVFIDAAPYLGCYGMNAHDLAMMIIKDVFRKTGITATVGIGSNLYLAKIAMDIMAKHMKADEDGVRIASLDEISFRRNLWDHRPLLDFWRIGRGTERKLKALGIHTMGDIARLSLDSRGEEILYGMFGVEAELIIDHAWGWEPCSMADIKEYRPSSRSISSSQVLKEPYSYNKARIIVLEMADSLAMEIECKGFVTETIVLSVGYDKTGVTEDYEGSITTDAYGRKIPKHARGTRRFETETSSSKTIMEAIGNMFDGIVDKSLLVRRIRISADVKRRKKEHIRQFDMFTSIDEIEKQEECMKKDNRIQEVLLGIRGKYGKNAVFRGMNLVDGATAIERNGYIGGHKA